MSQLFSFYRFDDEASPRATHLTFRLDVGVEPQRYFPRRTVFQLGFEATIQGGTRGVGMSGRGGGAGDLFLLSKLEFNSYLR